MLDVYKRQGLISGGIEIAGQAMSGKKIDEIDWWSVVIETITGAALGALPGLNMSVGAVALAKGTIGTLNAMAHRLSESPLPVGHSWSANS